MGELTRKPRDYPSRRRKYLSAHLLRMASVMRKSPHGATVMQISAETGLKPSTIRQGMTDLRALGYRIVCQRVFVLRRDPYSDDRA